MVYAKKPFKNADHIIGYLGRYTHRVAIGNNRIIGIQNEHVLFKWKDYKDHGIQKIMKLPASEFIRRFLLHILPKGFCKIRYFGIFASRNRKLTWKQCCRAIGYAFAKSKFNGLSWKQTLFVACGIDVCLCPVCKTGKMQTTLLFNSTRSPPHVSTIVL